MALIDGTAGDDFLVGTPDDDTINGYEGNDELVGLEGDDTLDGGDGDDALTGNSGDDHLDGGDGLDLVYYLDAGAGVFVNLAAGTASGADGNDTLISIEWVIGSRFDDELVGSDGHDLLDGQQGNDTLLGGAGHDFFRGGAGDDLIEGGEGFDRVSHFGNPAATTGVTVSLLLQGAPQDTGHGWDTLIGIEALSGSPFDDVLIGDHGANWLVNSGNSGNDTLSGEGGDDLLEVDIGDHSLHGGAGSDTVSFLGLGFVTGAVSASLALQGAPQDTGRGMMTLTGIENLSGTPFDDHLAGDGGDNLLAGHGGSDTLIGGGGNDMLYGDGAVMSDDPTGSGVSGPPELFADLGFTGDDTLEGGKGDDTLIGGGGDDVLSGGQGRDRFAIGDGTGDDRITDFEKKDVIVIEADGVDDMSDLTIATVGGKVVISWGTGDSVTLESFKAKHLSADNFDFGDPAPAAAFVSFGAASPGWGSAGAPVPTDLVWLL